MTTVQYLDETRVTAKRFGQRPAGYRGRQDGYGSKIPTSIMLQLDGKRWHRVYCVCWSNAGSLYVVAKGESLFLGAYDPH